MGRIRYWALFLGLILLVNAILILMNAEGRIEGYVSSAICLLAGVSNVVYAFWRRSATPDTSEQRRD